jgi:hypothetical protein
VAYGRQARLRRRSVDSFFVPLVRGDDDAGRRRRSWSSMRDDEDLAGSLEVIKSEFFFQLLMRLFANPSCRDGGG